LNPPNPQTCISRGTHATDNDNRRDQLLMANSAKGRHALGFRVKSGWATAVLLGGTARAPQVLDCGKVDLSDDEVPETRQPHHAGMGMLQTDQAKVSRLSKIIARAALRSVAEMMQKYKEAGHVIPSAGLVVGSEIDPAKVGNPHIRAHALEGRLFRTALQDALDSCGVRAAVYVERSIHAHAAERLKKSETELKSALITLGKGFGGPWRANEKTAALAAWLALV
jgi:hypothetical protein